MNKRISILVVSLIVGVLTLLSFPTSAMAMGKMGLGLGYNVYNKDKVLDLGDTWVYNWGAGVTEGTNNPYTDFGENYVPMLWSCSMGEVASLQNWILTNNYEGYVLLFNEPESTTQTASSCATYVGESGSYVRPTLALKSMIDFKNANNLDLKFIIGGVQNESTNSNDTWWLTGFHSYWLQIYGSEPDIAGVHYHLYAAEFPNIYGSNCFNSAINNVTCMKAEMDDFDDYYDTTSWLSGKEVWITETGVLWNLEENVNRDFVNTVFTNIIPLIQNNPRVNRYAWFSYDRRAGITDTDDTLLAIDGVIQSTYYIFQDTCINLGYCNPSNTLGPNLVLNSNFENNTKNWTFKSTPLGAKLKNAYTTVQNDKHMRTRSDKMAQISGTKSATGSLTSTAFKLKSNTTYTASLINRVSLAVGATAPITLIVREVGSTAPLFSQSMTANNNWSIPTGTFTTGTVSPSQNFEAVAQVGVKKGSVIFLDNIQVRENNVPAGSTMADYYTNFEMADYESWIENMNYVQDPDFDGNLLLNNTFETEDYWNKQVTGGTMYYNIINDEAVLNVVDKGSTAQFYQHGVPITQGKTYRLSFNLWGDSTNQAVKIKMFEHGSPYDDVGTFTGIGSYVTISSLSTTLQEYSYEFVASQSEPDTRLQVLFTKNGKYYIDNMILEEVQ